MGASVAASRLTRASRHDPSRKPALSGQRSIVQDGVGLPITGCTPSRRDPSQGMVRRWPMSAWLKKQAARVREALMLDREYRLAVARSPKQQARLRRLFCSGHRRAQGARTLRYERQAASALTLYREAIAYLVTAQLVAEGVREQEDVLDAELVWAELRARLESDTAHRPKVSLDSLKGWLAGTNSLAVDRAAASEPRQAWEAADEVVRWLEAQTEPRTEREIKLQRGLRIGALALVGAVLLCAAIAAAVAPENVAFGKPVTTSSQKPGSPDPSGVVDGVVDEPLGMLTKNEKRPWVEIDLGEPYNLNEIVVYNRGDGHHRQSTPLKLYLGTEPKQRHGASRRKKPFCAYKPWRIKLDEQVARYVRLSASRKTELGLSEIEVYGTCP
jgi:hypothetical protein